MGTAINKLTIRGYKSIRELVDFELRPVNVLIGANGAGKSNFVSFFRMLRAMADEGLNAFAREQGGADGFFFQGLKVTPTLFAELTFGVNAYQFMLAPTAESGLMFKSEYAAFRDRYKSINHGAAESALKQRRTESGVSAEKGVCHYVYEAVSSWTVYHFHDTSRLAAMRRDQPLSDRYQFNPDASNLAAFLCALRDNPVSKPCFDRICDTVRLVAPYFDEFILNPRQQGPEEKIRLEWRQKGSAFPFQPYHFSDGTIRFICLATALLQPNPPSTIVIDEPELGLHPYALEVLAALVKEAGTRTQTILSTQSATLLNHFTPEDVVVVDRKNGESLFRRLDSASLAEWLNDYTLGDLWQKNVL